MDATDTDNQTWHRVAKWLALLTIKEDERALGGKVIEYMVNYRRLSGAAKHPGARERRLLVRWQRARQLCVDGGLLTPQHPAERDRECCEGRHLHICGFQVSVCRRRLLDGRIGVIEPTCPLRLVHEGAGFSFAGRQLALSQFMPRPASEGIFRNVVLLFPDTIKRHTERV